MSFYQHYGYHLEKEARRLDTTVAMSFSTIWTYMYILFCMQTCIHNTFIRYCLSSWQRKEWYTKWKFRPNFMFLSSTALEKNSILRTCMCTRDHSLLHSTWTFSRHTFYLSYSHVCIVVIRKLLICLHYNIPCKQAVNKILLLNYFLIWHFSCYTRENI